MDLWQIWLVTAIVLAGLEIISGTLIFLWFALAAVVTALLTLAGFPFWLQGTVFVGCSLILILATRPLVKRFVHDNNSLVKTNLDKLLGRTAIVTEKIEAGKGLVDLQGEIWSAKAAEIIELESKVEVIAVEGVKLVVKKIEEE